MQIGITKVQNKLVLGYTPDSESIDRIKEVLHSLGTWRIKKTFYINLSNYNDFQNLHLDPFEYELFYCSISFCIGELIEGYYRLDPGVFKTKHVFYIQNSEEFKFKENMFVCKYDISIVQKIDEMVDSDVYIGNDSTKPGYLPIEQYKLLVSKFPGTAELKHYAHARIATILHEYFDDSDAFTKKYNRFLERKKSIKRHQPQNSFVKNEGNVIACFESSAVVEGKLYELEQFKSICTEFGNRLNGHYSETQWQPFIKDVIRFVFPKYIMSIREVIFDGIDAKEDDSEKKPDFILIDTNGFVDILEVKKPDVLFLTTRPSYRKNYIPTRELSGAIQQIEKYIFCLNHSSQKNTDRIQQKITTPLPEGVSVRIMNPLGLLILGRSKGLNKQQKRDFELIKRQYKHIVELMTYDELYAILKNITQSLENELKESCPNSNT